MATRAEIEQQLTRERDFRSRLGVPTALGGVLYIVSAVVVGSTLGSTPSVGLLQGVAPALRGEAQPRVSPRAEEVRFVSHHAAPLIVSSVLAAAAIVILTIAVLALLRATRFRRPESWPPTAAFLITGGVAFAAIGVAHQVALAITTHQFATGHDFSNQAVERALTKGTANVALGYAGFIAGIALAVGMIATMTNSMRVGLLTRWMGVLGIISAFVIFLPTFGPTFDIVPAFWLAALGLLYMGRWPGGEPPAWAAGEARPWPTQAERAAERQGAAAGASAPSRGRRSGQPAEAPENGAAGAPAESEEAVEDVPEPSPRSRSGTAAAKRKRRKRRARR